MTTIVYRYGLLPPTENAETVREQMLLAHRYKNSLVAVERIRRDKSRAILSGSGDVAALESECATVDAECRASAKAMKAKRASTRSRSETAEMKQTHEAIKVRLRDVRARLSTAKRVAKDSPEVVAARKANKRDTATLTKAARSANGLYWGTGAVVDDAIKAASKEPLYAFGEPCDPSFKRWTGEAAIGIQVHQKGESGDGLSVESFLHGTGDARNWLYSSPRLREVREPHQNPKVEAARLRNAARRDASERLGTHEYRNLHLRIGTKDEKGRPALMATFPMVVHRPLPPNAIIKRVVVQCRKIGPREEWYCCLTVATEGLLKDPAPADGGSVAVEIGWHSVPLPPHPKRPDVPRVGVQVARYLTAGGLADMLVIDLGGLRKADELRSIREKNFNDARGALVDWLRENTVPDWVRALTVKRGSDLPSEAQALAWLEAWKSPARLAGLCRRMQAEGFGGDAVAYTALRAHLRDTRLRGDAEAARAVEDWRHATGLFPGEAGAISARMEVWRYHDNHLWRWESDQRKKAERMRQDTYRAFAAKLASEHPRLLVSDAVYSEMARRPGVDGERVNETAAKNRQGAAPGALREALVAAFKARGGEVVKVAAAGLSTTCPDCGSCDPGQRDNVGRMCRCVACQAEHDIDDTALLNMLRVGGETASVWGIKWARKAIKDAIEQGESNAAE